jgi:hypothetical protein
VAKKHILYKTPCPLDNISLAIIIFKLAFDCMSCIYKKSKFYATATLNPQDIVEPIGYKFLNQAHDKKASKPKNFG